MVSKYGEDPLSFVDITDPLQTPCCKQIFQRDEDPKATEGINVWLRKDPTCPMCRKPLTEAQLIVIKKVDEAANSNIKDPALEPEAKKPRIIKAGEEEAIEPAIRVLAPPPPAPEPLHIAHLTEYELEATFRDLGVRDKLVRVPPDEVVTCIMQNTLPAWLYPYLTDAQMQAVRLVEIGRERINRFFPAAVDTEENRRKFALLQPADVAGALLLEKLSARLCMFLSDAQLQAIPLPALNQEQISQLLSDRILPEERSRRFALLPAQEVVDAIRANTLPQNLYKLLSDAHLQVVPLSKFSQEKISNLFSNYILEDERRRRFALLPANEVLGAIRANTLPLHLYKLLSDAQLQALRPSELSHDQIFNLFPNYLMEDERRRRFAQLPANEVGATIRANTLPQYLYKLLSDAQLQAVRLSELRQEQMNWMFPSSHLENENRRRFAFISNAEVLALVTRSREALPLRLQDYLSDAHIEVINNA